jgi:very-short-patch-repair endonuclease
MPKTKTTKEFINDAIAKHGSTYDYSEVDYHGVTVKVTIICKEHGNFDQSPRCHLRGKGCIRCSGTYKKTTEEYIEDAIKVHGLIYDYSQIDCMGSNQLTIICNKHGEFKQSKYNHLRGQGCPTCSKNRRIDILSKTTEEFIEECYNIWDPNRTYEVYDWSDVEYINCHTNILIYCLKHDVEFEQDPHNHVRGSQGCTECISESHNKKEYKIVKLFKEFLPETKFIHNKTIKVIKKKPDIRFDCKTYQLIVEVDEFQHRDNKYEDDRSREVIIQQYFDMPCIFIRYNPDHKDTNQSDLVEKVKKYLSLTTDPIESLTVEFMFYN